MPEHERQDHDPEDGDDEKLYESSRHSVFTHARLRLQGILPVSGVGRHK